MALSARNLPNLTALIFLLAEKPLLTMPKSRCKKSRHAWAGQATSALTLMSATELPDQCLSIIVDRGPLVSYFVAVFD